MLHNYAQMVRANESAGHHWFSREAMRFFDSRVLKSSIRPVGEGAYFVSSERFDADSPRLFTVRFISNDGHVGTVGEFQQYGTAKQAKGALKALLGDPNYRWIIYLHQPMGGFDVQRVSSIEEAKSALHQWSRDVYVYEQATASLYPYSKEDWAEAKEYEEIGCPFDYPSKVMEFGPRGGIKVEST